MIAKARRQEPELSDKLSQLRDALQTLYRELDEAVARHGPVCELSGRCCRFREYGHTLFLSIPEAELLFADAPPPVRPLDDGESCPWQDATGRCRARNARPLGCRVYFCDPAFAPRAYELSEAFLTRLKELVRQHGWSWDYAPLHHHLRSAWHDGRPDIARMLQVQPSKPINHDEEALGTRSLPPRCVGGDERATIQAASRDGR